MPEWKLCQKKRERKRERELQRATKNAGGKDLR